MHRALINFASGSSIMWETLQFFPFPPLSAANVVLENMRFLKRAISHPLRPSGQTPHRVHWIGLRLPYIPPSNGIRQFRRRMMTRVPSSVQVSWLLKLSVIRQRCVLLSNYMPAADHFCHLVLFRNQSHIRCLSILTFISLYRADWDLLFGNKDFTFFVDASLVVLHDLRWAISWRTSSPISIQQLESNSLQSTHIRHPWFKSRTLNFDALNYARDILL